MGSERGFLSRSWAMLTAEKGWYRPILIIAAISCIPVVGTILGTLVLTGYAYEWARLTAWGVDSVPKQRGIKPGELFSSGWRCFAVRILWSIMIGLIVMLISQLLSFLFLGFLGALLQLAMLFAGAFAMVAALRAAIYQKFSAGFGVNQLWDMLKRDPRGFLRLFLITVLSRLCVYAVVSILGMMLFASRAQELITVASPLLEGIYYDYLTSYDVAQFLREFFGLLATMTPAFVIISFITHLFTTAFELLAVNATGLWMRQFDVPAWGSPSDPLPGEPTQS